MRPLDPRLLALVVPILSLGSVGCQSDQEKAAEAVAAALPLMESAPEQAAEALAEATRLDPTSAAAFGHLADAHLALGAFPEAEQAAHKAVELEDSAAHRESLARARAGLEEWEPALADYRRALERDPERTEVLVEIARMHERLDQREPAEEAYRRAIEADARPLEARVGLAGLLVARGEREESRQLLEAVREGGEADTELGERVAALLARVDELDAEARSPGALAAAAEGWGSLFGADATLGDDPWLGFRGDRLDGSIAGPSGLGIRGTGMPNRGPPPSYLGNPGYGTIGRGAGSYGAGAGAPTRGSPEARVRTPPPEVQGALAADVVGRVIRRHIDEVRHCHATELRVTPNLVGRVSIRFVVTTEGRVGTATVIATTARNARVEQCLLQAVRRWTFPQPSDGVAVVRQDFDLATER